MSMSNFRSYNRRKHIPVNELAGTYVPGAIGGGELLTGFDFGTGTNIFNTGFAGTMALAQESPAQYAAVSGTDSQPWTDLISGKIGRARIYYEEGDATKRIAQIVDSPDGADGHGKVLNFKLTESNITLNGIPKKGRIQLDLDNASGITDMYMSFDMRLGADVSNLRNMTTNWNFWTIQEWWNTVGGALNPYSFRMSLAIHKEQTAAGTPLTFSVHGQQQDANGKWGGSANEIWSHDATHFEIPTDQWMNIKVRAKQGLGTNGKFQVIAKPFGGTSTLIFDVSNDTYHASNPSPTGFEVHALKMYTGDDINSYMKSLSKDIDVYYDNFEVWYQ